MMLNEGNCLSVSNIKRSIDLMDEFVDGDYEYLELKNWFSVIDSRNRGYSVYDNTGRMQVSLIVSEKRLDREKPLCAYEPTMTELRHMKYHHIYLDCEYPEDSMSHSIRIACQKWKKDEFIDLPNEICVRAQTSYNRMDYGCEWLGGGDWEEKTMYGETTDFFIIGIVMREPYKHIQQEALEILGDLKCQHDALMDEFNQLLSLVKNTTETIIHKSLGKAPKEGRPIEFTGDLVVVQFEDRIAKFQFPDSYFKGFLVNPLHEDNIRASKVVHERIVELGKQISTLEQIIEEDDFSAIYSFVWSYRESKNKQ